jgi:translation initiation factor IF-1
MSKDFIEVTGAVVEVLPNTTFKVKLDDSENIVVCYTSGRLRQNKIKIVTGDRVKLEISVYDLTKGRISYRL